MSKTLVNKGLSAASTTYLHRLILYQPHTATDRDPSLQPPLAAAPQPPSPPTCGRPHDLRLCQIAGDNIKLHLWAAQQRPARTKVEGGMVSGRPTGFLLFRTAHDDRRKLRLSVHLSSGGPCRNYGSCLRHCSLNPITL
ncbi:unnamed protein product [Cuscuta campestris]|uniref:Uncharacterized protein n=1 Tax=Cuscuta campestris TaxID=132261 RepID=A0A484KN65_9ASTE|nr:unnamed protein product [Cuscuta campestris]